MGSQEATFKVIPKFDGSQDIEAWIRVVDRVARLKKWSNADNESNIVLNTSIFLEKEARAWADHVKLDTILVWEEVKKMMISRWKPSLSCMTVIQSLLQMKKKRGESFHAFADRILVTAGLTTGINEDMVIEAFLRGIHTRYHAIALSKPKGIIHHLVDTPGCSHSSYGDVSHTRRW